MKIMQSDDIMTKPISEILEPDWDVRLRQEDESGLITLANSIRKDGFINPITCVREGSKFKIIAGRRRFKAAKMIGLKEVPIYIKDDMSAEDINARRIALIENIRRRDMNDTESAHTFFEIFKLAGYKKEQVISGVKSIDNWFHNNPGKIWDDLLDRENFSITESDNPHKANELRYDPKFVEICKDIDFSPKYQYQLMEILVYLKPDVLKLAEKAGLSIDQKIALTIKPLRDHPRLQKELIHEIEEDLPRTEVHERIKEVAMQLAEGHLRQLPSGEYVKKKNETEEEHVKQGDKVLEPPQIQQIKVRKAIKEFLFRMTDRSLTHGEFQYSTKIIESTQGHRIELVKVGDEKTLTIMRDDLLLVASVTMELLEFIDQEFESREQKKEMMKQ